jgi:hypothetical protein
VPVTFIGKLNKPLGDRVTIAVIMGLGLLAGVAAIIKLVGSTRFGMNEAMDFLFYITDYVMWCWVEVNICISAACIPSLKAMFERLLQRWNIIKVKDLSDSSGDYSLSTQQNERLDRSLALLSATTGSEEHDHRYSCTDKSSKSPMEGTVKYIPDVSENPRKGVNV